MSVTAALPTSTAPALSMSPRNLQTLTATYPDLWDQPELAMELANSPLPTTQMLSQSLSAIGTIEAQKKINFTRLLPDAEQERWWNSLNASQQDVYRTLGYDRGNQASSEPSITDFWKGGGVSGAIGGVLSTVGRGIGQSVDLVVPDQVSTAITSGVGDALHALTVIGDTAPHLYRTAVAVGEDFGIQGDQSFFDGLAAMGGTLVKTVTDPGRVVEAFLETGVGERFHTQASKDAALEFLNGDVQALEIALELSGGSDLEEILLDAGLDLNDPANQQEIVELNNFMSSPAFREAMTALGQGKVSPGRWVANSLGMRHGTTGYNIVSGLSDAGVLLFLDPTLVLGKAARISRVARYAIGGTDDMARWANAVDDIYHSTRGSGFLGDKAQQLVRRISGNQAATIGVSTVGDTTKLAYGEIARILQEGSIRELMDVFPQLTPMVHAMKQHGFERLVDADSVHEFFRSSTAMHAMLRGRAGTHIRDTIELPALTRGGLRKQHVKHALRNEIDFLAEAHGGAQRGVMDFIRPLDEADLELPAFPMPSNLNADDILRLGIDETAPVVSNIDAQKLIDEFPEFYSQFERQGLGFLRQTYANHSKVFAIPRGAARFIQGFTRHIPADALADTGGKAIRLYGPDATQQIANFVDMGALWNVPAPARNAWLEYIVRAPEGARSVAVRSYIDTMFRNVGLYQTSEGREYVRTFLTRAKHLYSSTGIDDMIVAGTESRSGILPGMDLAELMAVPDIRELIAMTKRHNVMRMVSAHGNSAFYTTAMNRVWKPAVLLRLGFIPRAAGEEWVSFMVRHPSLYFQRKFLRFAADDVGWNDIDGVGVLDGTGLLPGMRPLAKATRRRKLRRAGATMPDGEEITKLKDFDLLTDTKRRGFGATQDLQQMTLHEAGRPVLNKDVLDYWADRVLARTTDWVRRGLQDGFFNINEDLVSRRFVGRALRRSGFSDNGGFLQLDPEDLEATRVLMRHNRIMGAYMNSAMTGQSGLMERYWDPENGVRIPLGDDGDIAQLVVLRSDYELLGPGDPFFGEAWFGALSRYAQRDEFGRAVAREGVDFIDDDMLLVWRELLGGTLGNSRVARNFDPEDVLRFPEAVGIGGPQAMDAWLRSLDEVLDFDQDLLYEIRRLLLKPDQDAMLHFRNMIDERARMSEMGISGAWDMGDLAWVDEQIGALLALEPFEDHVRLQRWLSEQLGKPDRQLLSSFEELVVRAKLRVRRMMLDPDMQDDLRKMESFTQLRDGTPIAHPVEDGMSRLSVPMVHREVVETLESLSVYEIRQLIATSTLSDESKQLLLNSLLDGDTHRGYRLMRGELDADVVPLMPVGVSDPDIAREISLWAQNELGMTPGLEGLFGTVDIPTNFLGRRPPENRGVWGDFTFQVSEAGGTKGYSLSLDNIPAVTPIDQNVSWRIVPQPDGSLAAIQGVDFETIVDEMADTLVNRYLELFEHRNGGKILHELTAPMRLENFDGLNAQYGIKNFFTLEDVTRAQSYLKDTINTPKLMMPEQPMAWDRFVRFGFDKVIGPAIDSIVRQPLYTDNFIRAYRQAKYFLDDLVDPALRAQADEIVAGMNRSMGEMLGSNPDMLDLSRLSREDLDLLDDYMRAVNFDRALEIDSLPDGGTMLFDGQNNLRQGIFDDLRKLKTGIDEGTLGLSDEAAARLGNIFDRAVIVNQDFGVNDLMEWMSRGDLSGGYQAWKRSLRVDDSLSRFELSLIDEDMYQALKQYHDNYHNTQQMLGMIAAPRAMYDSIPFIDSHKMRSQFQQWVGNFVPFWFAEEQFIKRWARTLRHSPEAFRRAQLGYHGLQSVGVVRTDPETGEDIYVYPGSVVAQEAIASVSSLVFGTEARLPIAMPLTGTVRYSTPGLDRLGTPSVGPLGAVPLMWMGNLFPELEPVENFLTGTRGQDRSILEHFTPSVVRRMWQAYSGDPDKDRVMATAVTTAIQYLEAADLTPPEDAPAEVHEEYLDRVRSWARSLAYTQALYAFVGPSSPSAGSHVGPKELTSLAQFMGFKASEIPQPQFIELLKTMPYEDALKLFIEENPDATPWTVFATERPSGARIPVNEEAFEFVDANEEFFGRYRMAGPWFLTPPEGINTDEFSYKAYQQQLAMEWRQRRDVDDFYRQLKFREASTQYFHNQDLKDQALALAPTVEQRNAIRDMWRDWKNAYLAQHPIFQEILESPDRRQRNREVLAEMRIALDDPDLPQTRTSEALIILMSSFDEFELAYNPLVGDRSRAATDARNSLRVRFRDWGEQFVVQYPEAREMWRSVVAPHLRIDLDES